MAALVAVKPWSRAKSRLDAVGGADRPALAQAMALDTCSALVGAGCRLVVVSDQPGLAAVLAGEGLAARVLPDPGGGLNPALALAAATATAEGASTLLAAVSDLPCLRAEDVRAVLAATGTGPGRWFVPDASGTGTTMLLARGRELTPGFEGASAARHAASGAVALAAPGPARLDVDSADDLARALATGAGPRTLAWARQLDRPPAP